MEQQLVTVCIITYNHENFIRQAIDGVLMQKTNFPFDIIVADDCSKDATTEILKEYQQKFPEKIKLILQQKNVGAAKNFVELISAPHSKYIAYFDGDDYWISENKLQKQIDFLEANKNYSLCYHHCNVINYLHYLNVQDIRKKNYTFSFVSSLYSKNGFSVSTVYRTEDFNIKQYEEIIRGALIGDWPMELLLLAQGKKGYFMAETMGVYRDHAEGATKKNFLAKDEYYERRLAICEKFRGITKYNRALNFFMGELYLHLSLHKKNGRFACFVKGAGLVLFNMHFQKRKNTNLSLQAYLGFLFKRIKSAFNFF